MILYIDTSALVKRYINETGSVEVSRLFDLAELVGTVVLARVEMAAALARAVRQKWIEATDAESAWQDFGEHWLSFTRLTVTLALVDRASRLAWEHGLRGYDAMHLSAALIWRESLDTPVTLATYDRDLWRAAQNSGLTVWPEG
jgi:uncharacterized protein